jgi:aminopeptidase-like protein
MNFSQIDFLKRLYPLHRTLVSDDLDKSLKLVGEALPNEFRDSYRILEVPSGTDCWTWKIPPKYTVKEAWLEDEAGNRIADFSRSKLHIASYSRSVDSTLTYEELLPHLHYNRASPDGIPWRFYYYKDDWAFCLSYHDFLKLDKNERYRVKIDSEFTPGALRIGELFIKGERQQELLLISNVCHPEQVNDSLTGVSCFLETLHELSQKRRGISIRCLFLPETIGSVAYFSQFSESTKNIAWGIFSEMLGNDDTMALQHSYPGDSYIDKVCRVAMRNRLSVFREGSFRTIVGNDELVSNGPGVGIPTVSLSRSKVTGDSFPGYHTSLDCPDNLILDNLQESKEVLTEIISILDADYVPLRTFKGPVFLSGYTLWGVWNDIPEGKERVDELMYRLEGELSIFEISEDIGVDFWETKRICDEFLSKGLIEKATKDLPR